MKTRKEGYYWVKHRGEWGSEWDIAKWSESWRGYNEWSLSGDELYREDDFFEEIDENRIIRVQSNAKEILAGVEGTKEVKGFTRNFTVLETE